MDTAPQKSQQLPGTSHNDVVEVLDTLATKENGKRSTGPHTIVQVDPPPFKRNVQPRHVASILQVLLIVIDAGMLALAFIMGYYARANLPLPSAPIGTPPPLGDYIPMLTIHMIAIVIFFYFTRMYHMKRAVNRFDMSVAIAQNVSIGTFMSIAIETMAFKNGALEIDYPRGVIVYAWLFSIVMVIVGREIHRQITIRLRQGGFGRDRVLVIGTNRIAISIINQIMRLWQLGYDIVGVVDNETTDSILNTGSNDLAILGNYNDLPRLIDDYQINQVLIALPDASRQELTTIINYCQRGTVDIKIFPDTFAFITSGLTVDELGGLPLLGVRDIALRGWKLSLKRGLDIVGSIMGLIFLSPFMLFIALLIYLTDRGPVFFCQERVGLDGKPFPMIKFRTMRVDAEQKSRWTVKNDARITKIGALLRRTNLDELPNLINVFYGQMSLVGPRPEQISFVEEFQKKFPRYMERHREKSGMTGWAQINGLRGDTSIQERLKYDLYYIENWSLWLDIKIILRTAVQTILFRNKNAY